jgi:hypothetical protein
MKNILLLAVVVLVCCRLAQAQDFASHMDLRTQLLFGPEYISSDSIQRTVVRRLQPENMSVLEHGLWDEDGIVRKVGIASPLTPEVRRSELSLRRGMLSIHQIGGFVALGFMGSACYFGQKILDGEAGYKRNHQYAVDGAIATYSATALLSLLSPPPMIRRSEMSTTTIHKTLAWVHVAGMILTPILGSTIGRNYTDSQRARFHQVSAYITTTAMAASMITVTF